MKKLKTTTIIEEASMVTHGGVFHSDDVFATAMLTALGFDKIARVFEVPENTSEFKIVFDIGGGQFDHHQGERRKREDGTYYSSFGLLWEKLAENYISKQLPDDFEGDTKKIAKAIEDSLVTTIDRIDNGQGNKEDYSIADVISSFNPTWKNNNFDEAFLAAVEFASGVLKRAVASAIATEEATTTLVTKYFNQRENSKVVVMEQYVPWNPTIFDVDTKEEVLYVVFPSARGGWNVQCVPDKPGSFGQRKKIQQEAKEITGVTFVHQGGFILATTTKEHAVEAANSLVNS